MKQFLLLLSLLLLHFLAISKPKISDIFWVGKNKEYLQILKKTAELRKGAHTQELKVVKYVKNSYIILSSEHITGYFEQRYDILHFTQDTLILAPVGKDVFKLCQLDENNQYVFINTLNSGFSFTKLHFVTEFFVASLDLYLQINLDIDAERKSRVKLHDDYMNETNIVTTSMGKIDYKRFFQILAACDINSIPEVTSYVPDPEDAKCCNSVLEIQYNGQVKKWKGCTTFPFHYPALEDFLVYYIASKSAQSGREPRLWYSKDLLNF